ncbi:MAG: DUF190 domain-containing protein [Acidobacteria bacterium]|nr:DUF190 domain-containing protein [Acidobacteriota bacterium]
MIPEPQPASKLTVFVGADERRGKRPLYEVVLGVLRECGVAGATVTKGVMGYGFKRRIHSDLNEITMENLPLVVEAVGEGEEIARAAERVAEMLGEHGLVEVRPTTLVARAPAGGGGHESHA